MEFMPVLVPRSVRRRLLERAESRAVVDVSREIALVLRASGSQRVECTNLRSARFHGERGSSTSRE